MANEIITLGTTGATHYAQVIRQTDGAIWNTATPGFEAYATANIANYDIALAEQGTASGLFMGNFPTGVSTAGAYTVVVRRRAGVSPAESDVVVGYGEIQWTGTAPTFVLGMLDVAAGIETGLTVRQGYRLMVAAAAGKLSGAATTTVAIRDFADTKNRVSATVDADGNRTAITTDLT